MYLSIESATGIKLFFSNSACIDSQNVAASMRRASIGRREVKIETFGDCAWGKVSVVQIAQSIDIELMKVLSHEKRICTRVR